MESLHGCVGLSEAFTDWFLGPDQHGRLQLPQGALPQAPQDLEDELARSVRRGQFHLG